MSQTGAIKRLSVYQCNSNNETFCIYKPFTKLLDVLNGRPYIGGFCVRKEKLQPGLALSEGCFIFCQIFFLRSIFQPWLFNQRSHLKAGELGE